MQSAEIEKLVSGMAEEILQGTDISLVDVEYVREKDWLNMCVKKIGICVFILINRAASRLMTARW